MSLDYGQIYEEQKGFLWGYCYRLTGDAMVADDLVQDTFVRALEKPPADTSKPWRPWLVRVATNLARDEFRRSKRGSYIGPWLPTPVRTDIDHRLEASIEPGISGRYELRESASIAFLLALEALTPPQRSILLLRDVYDYSVQETAEILEISAANVKTTLHRARKALEAYNGERIPLDADRVRRTGEVLQKLLALLAARDKIGLEALLTENVRSLSDGNGRFYSAKVPVVGAARVALLYSKIAPPAEESLDLRVTSLNFLPATLIHRPQAPPGFAETGALALDVDPGGRIASLYMVVAPMKLTALHFRR